MFYKPTKNGANFTRGLQYLRISTKSSRESDFPNTLTLLREPTSKRIWLYFIIKHIADKKIGLGNTRSDITVGKHYSKLLKETYSSTRRATSFGSWGHNPVYHIYRLQQAGIRQFSLASKHLPASRKFTGFSRQKIQRL